MALYALGERVPTVDPAAYVHPDASVIGDVHIAAGATVWPGAVLRGDYGTIRIGADTSIQDGTVIHATEALATLVGRRCVVGHAAHLEGCTVGDDCLIGSGSVVLQRVQVGSGALVAAGAVVSPGTVVPAGAMALGVPARIREGAADPSTWADAVGKYVANGQRYAAQLRRLD